MVPQHSDVQFVAGVLISKWCPSTKMYDLLMVSGSRSGGPALRCTFCCRCLRSRAPALRCTICCRCLGLEVVPQHEDVRFVAGVLVSKWCPSTKMYDLLPGSWSRRGAPTLRCTFCCWCLRSGAPARRCTICCRSLGLEVVPQH